METTEFIQSCEDNFVEDLFEISAKQQGDI